MCADTQVVYHSPACFLIEKHIFKSHFISQTHIADKQLGCLVLTTYFPELKKKEKENPIDSASQGQKRFPAMFIWT